MAVAKRSRHLGLILPRGELMLGSVRLGRNQGQLRPFVLKLRDSFLIGLTPEPEQGSPCVHCVELWLVNRRVFSERMNVQELPIRTDILNTIIKLNDPHVLYEVSNDGTDTRMDCFVYPHPACGCARESFIKPVVNKERLNFAFSPINQIKCARYGVPSGNLWLTSASGSLGAEGKMTRVFATASDREQSRLRAVEQWMKRTAFDLYGPRSGVEHQKGCEDFVTGQNSEMSLQEAMRTPECIGAGANREEAILDGLQEFARIRTLAKYTGQVKKPMLVVGANNWIRNHVPFFLLQQYDLHLLFYPNSTPTWVVGLAALSRVKTTEAPIFIFDSDKDISTALTRMLAKMLEHCRPVDWLNEADEEPTLSEAEMNRNRKLANWWNNWIYGCPKISVKDVLHLEPYTNSLETWRNYLADGQERLKILELNNPLLPVALRHLVKVYHPSLSERASSNVNGIGTMRSFVLRSV